MSEPIRQQASPAEVETREWLDSLEYVLATSGPERVIELLDRLQDRARRRGVSLPFATNTPYVNTIPPEQQPPYPGDHRLEQRLRDILRWNAAIMVVRANQEDPTIGGHIATYASAATLMEVAFHHFLRGRTEGFEGDHVFFQAHTSPGIYARAFLEGRLSEAQLVNFRHELRPGGGLPSYPHPRLMPGFWPFPSASMGLAPIMAIYQAHYNRYLEDRGLKEPGGAKVWAFLGDGEMDEPEALGAISLASRERLDNLVFVINCNLQRLDGPVRGNAKIIQELETVFRGAEWNVIKVIWGSDWDPLLARDPEGLLARRMGELVDGQYQKYSVSTGEYQRQHFFGGDERLMRLSQGLTDEQIRTIRRGGHDPEKVHAALRAATECRGAPSVVLAKTIKGFGMGRVGEGAMTAHQLKRLDMEVLREMRTRFDIPLSDEEVEKLPFYRPPEDSPEIRYLLQRRRALGGFVPERSEAPAPSEPLAAGLFQEFHQGSRGRRASTTMVLVRILAKLLRDPGLGRLIVPMVPDEARTFGMEGLFRQYGIYSHIGQLYEPVDSESLTYYREARDGQLIQEGITEAGALSTFIASGTAYSTHGVPTLPFFVFYSIFGFQRVGDLIWAAGDQRARGFLIGATSGRTTLNGEGPAAPGRPQPHRRLRLSPRDRLRPRPRLRGGRHRRGRDPPHAARGRARHLLPDGDQRLVRDAAHARGGPRGDPEGDVPAAAIGPPTAQEEGPPLRLGGDSNGSPGRAADPRGGVRRRRRRVERDQLQAAPPGGGRRRALEPPAPRRDAARPVRAAVPGGRDGRLRRGQRLREVPAQLGGPLVPAAPRGPRHRRLRPQRVEGRPAPVLRGRRRHDRLRRPGRLGAPGRAGGEGGPPRPGDAGDRGPRQPGARRGLMVG